MKAKGSDKKFDDNEIDIIDDLYFPVWVVGSLSILSTEEIENFLKQCKKAITN